MSLRRTAAGLLTGGLALTLVAAGTTAATPSVGTASTRLLGAELTITGLGDLPPVQLLDVVTAATTDGTPLASTSVVPIRAGGETVGASGASSDGATTDDGAPATFGDLLGPLGLSVSPVASSATATADSAFAHVQAATAELGALTGALGLDLALADIVSVVNPDGAAANQAMTVSGLDLGLGDLGLGADVLGTLPLDVVLALLEGLPVDLPADVQAVVDELLAGAAGLEEALATLAALAAPLQESTEGLGLLGDALPEVQTLTDLLDQVNALLAGDLLDAVAALLGGLADTLATAGCALGAVPDLTNVVALLEGAVTCLEGQLTDIADGLVAGGLADFDGVLPADLLAAVEDAIATVTAALPDQLTALLDQLGVIATLVDTLADLFAQLDGILDLLPGLLDDAAGLDLLSVGAFDVGTTAIAAPTADESSATILCDAVAVTVLGQVTQTPDCSESLAGLADVTAAIDGALATLTGVLNTLPLAGLLEVGDLRADVFSNVVEEVTEVDGVVTSTAGFDLLDLEIPTLTLDPSAITDPLGDLGVPLDALDTVTGLLDGLAGDLGAVGDLPGVGDVIATLDDAIAGLDDPAGLGTTLSGLLDLVASLDLGDLGSLTESISTPGLALRIDPVSTATFAAGAPGTTPPAPAPTPTPTPAPAPTPTPDPTLPSTGGGFAVLGVLALAGALGLRRHG